MRLQRLNVINKEIKPFEKEFYNSLNLTNLSQEDLQLNAGAEGRGGYCTGENCPGVIIWGAVDIGVNCPGGYLTLAG